MKTPDSPLVRQVRELESRAELVRTLIRLATNEDGSLTTIGEHLTKMLKAANYSDAQISEILKRN